MTRVLVLASCLAAATTAVAQPAMRVESRGELLYTTHCIECHTTQMHWRDPRKAHDWASLRTEVQRWQGHIGLQWNDADITEVARHLNDTIYRFPQTGERVGQAAAR